ncbi:hypothetical protein AL471_013240 [Vibrio alginolyticus]|nr:hypothetical protein AL471_013240 [Vibrio alginolyticus]
MNYHELHRFSIIQDVLNNKLKCREATSILGISYRHLSRILYAVAEPQPSPNHAAHQIVMGNCDD